MDSVTQIALGAAVGELVLGKKAGNKAPLWGAVAGTIPDLDIFAGHFVDTVDALAIHRGFTHSILFSLIFAPVLGYIIFKIHKGTVGSWQDWTKLSFWSLFTHPLLDCFTTWGTQLFWPLDTRISFQSIFVIDPLYTLPLLICLIWLLFKPKASKIRRKLNYIGLGLSSFYLLITLVNKSVASHTFKESMNRQGIDYIRYNTRPSPLNTILWAATAETKEGFYTGYYSFLDESKDIHFHYFEKNHFLLNDLRDHPKVEKLLKITKGYYIVRKAEDGYLVYDLRFGQRNDWETGEGDFVFTYLIKEKQGRVEIEDVPNTMKDGKVMLRQFWKRLRGI